MNYQPVTLNSMLRSLTRYWKIPLICMILGIMFGFGGAIIFAGRGAATPSGTAEELKEVDFSEILQDRSYYSNMLAKLDNAYTETGAYLDVVMSDASVTKEQKQLLFEQKEQLQDWYAEDYQPVVRQSDQMEVLVPLSLLDEEVTIRQKNLHDNQLKLLSAEAAVEVAKSIRPPVIDNEASLSYYNTILARTVEYGDLLKQIQIDQEALTSLEEKRDEITVQINEFDQDIHTVIDALKEIRQTVSNTVNSICQTNALILTAYPNDPKTLDPVLTHGHIGASYEENFQIIVLFCALVGLALGMFLAVCRGAKKTQPQQGGLFENSKND